MGRLVRGFDATGPPGIEGKTYVGGGRETGALTAEPDSLEGQLHALCLFFLMRYREEIVRRFPAFRGAFPLDGASRLDLVVVNGGGRVHFVYRRGEEGHVVVMRELTLGGHGSDASAETPFVLRALDVEEPLVHFVLHPPYSGRFDRVEEEAVIAVRRHARIRPGH